MSTMFPISCPPSGEWLCSNDILSWKFPSSIGSYTLIGRSRAADATSLYIPQLDMLLDCGCLVTPSRPLYIFITHAHADHCADVSRFPNRARPPQIYIPMTAAQPMKDFLLSFRILKAAGRILTSHPTTWPPNYEIIGVQPDDLLSFRKTMKIRVFDMDHSIPCVGYGFYECRQKLKTEYAHLKGNEIAKMRKDNPDLQVSEERLKPLFAFMGDTTAIIFERYSNELFQFPLIIIECSFIDNEQHAERACDVKHIIWDDLEPLVLQHPEITFVLIHFSQQYKSERIRDFFKKLNLPNVVPFI